MARGFHIEPIDAPDSRFDPVLALLVLVMVMTGLGMLWSASWFRAEQLYGEPLRFILRQSLWVAVGMVVLVAAAWVPLDLVRRLLPMVLLVTAVFSVLTFVPEVSARYMGARRWIVLGGVTFQPSEMVKLTLVLYLAHIFARHEGDFSDPLHSLLPPALIAIIFASIVLLQNDFSTAVFLVAVTLAIFFAAGVPLSYYIRMAVLLVPVVLITLFTREHRVRRIIAFLRPEYDPAGAGFQVLAARRALRAGGFWGVGIGQSARKFGGLPEPQSDFLFAILGEELGFIGVLAVIGLFVAFGLRGIHLARRQPDWFRSLLVFGLTTSIVFQALLNIAVAVGAVPATGIPLPLFSSGGSSVIFTFAMCGLLFNAARVGGPARVPVGRPELRIWETHRA